MNITIEVGKYYRTANGMKVRVVAVDGVEPYPIIGIIDGHFNGNWKLDGSHRISSNLIISEWIDKPCPPWAEVPRWFNWFAMDSDYRQFYYPDKPQTSGCRAWVVASEKMMLIPPDHRIPVTCDWKDSLVERPKV